MPHEMVGKWSEDTCTGSGERGHFESAQQAALLPTSAAVLLSSVLNPVGG